MIPNAWQCTATLRTLPTRSPPRAALQSQTDRLITIEDEDAAVVEAVNGEQFVHTIKFGSHVIGQLAVQPIDNDRELADIVRLIAAEIGGPLRIATLVEESRRLASYDPLTGIMNRRAFVDNLAREIDRAQRVGATLWVVLTDVDHFKLINDNFGHKAGDQVLATLGRLFDDQVKGIGAAARWGGEEFVLAISEGDREQAVAFAEQLRDAVSRMTLKTDDGEDIPLTISLGVAELMPGEPFDSLVERADYAMYAAKVGGRNRVEIAASEIRVRPVSLLSTAARLSAVPR